MTTDKQMLLELARKTGVKIKQRNDGMWLQFRDGRWKEVGKDSGYAYNAVRQWTNEHHLPTALTSLLTCMEFDQMDWEDQEKMVDYIIELFKRFGWTPPQKGATR